MKALVKGLEGVGVCDVELPRSGPNDVLIKVARAGLCRTDIHVAQGLIPAPLPIILGHEFCGFVERAPSGSSLLPGTLVTAIPVLGCGTCGPCLANEVDPPGCTAPCMLGVNRDGVFAEYVAVPVQVVVPLPHSMPLRRAAYVEPMAAAMAVLRAPINASQRGLVYGNNRIAQLTHWVLRSHHFEHVDIGTSGEPSAYDFVIETEPNAKAFRDVLDYVRPRGLIVLKSRSFGPVPLDVTLAVTKEVKLEAVRYGSFRRAAETLASSQFRDDAFFEKPAQLADYEAVFNLTGEAKKRFFALGQALSMLPPSPDDIAECPLVETARRQEKNEPLCR
jgi:threonine dehydrogenase-like Zn-dependent dehydrogenase